jgi:dolichyl-phosphate-mannose--protein O-mannosyl transferase
MLNFYFKDQSVIEYRTQASLTWVDYFSSIGGLLGLFISLSWVTLFELLWLYLSIVFEE